MDVEKKFGSMILNQTSMLFRRFVATGFGV